MDFFEKTANCINDLSRNEMKIYKYILENMECMHEKTIRNVAEDCFVSTSTILRFARKLGFEGYNEMVVITKYTSRYGSGSKVAITEHAAMYRENYMSNIEKTIKVLDDRNILNIVECIKKARTVCIYMCDWQKFFGNYIELLLGINKIDARFPINKIERSFYSDEASEEDAIIVIDYIGDNSELIKIISKIQSQGCDNIISITQPNTNIIQNLCKYNLYYFADQTIVNGINITSNISAMAILELLSYSI